MCLWEEKLVLSRCRLSEKEMPPLKSLQQEYPAIDARFLHFCTSRGIISVEDFLIHDLNELVAFAEQDPDSEDLKKGILLVLSYIDGQHQSWRNGLELLQDAERNNLVLSTGCDGIDFLLQGGLHEGQLTELVGSSSSGKTQVCLQAASNIAVKYMGTVMFLDSCNSFSAKHIAHLISPLLTTRSKEVKERSLQRAMSKILCQSVFDIFTLLHELNQLDTLLRSEVKSKEGKMHLLIIDSVSSLITPVLGGRDSNGHSLMTSAGFLLKKLANEHNLSVLVTNHTVGGERGIPKPALGESWKSIPHVRLMLSRESGSSSRKVSVLKHPSVASGVSAYFELFT
ncbi:DNA repair protein RAD51 homolog 4 isoform X2 [Aristolochia californica]|uniref:DNA repair protein RAD51 homolog 4 isoform X2 n=1 Tax=Aristolochia californica TaxID=171875 RepID=UPI0035D5EA2E